MLDRRLLPPVTAPFSAASGVLTVIGDARDNTISVSRRVDGSIQVDDIGVFQGANGTTFTTDVSVPIRGGTATVANTRLIQEFGLGGNDHLSLNEVNGP